MSNYRVYPARIHQTDNTISYICIYIVANAQWCMVYLFEHAKALSSFAIFLFCIQKYTDILIVHFKSFESGSIKLFRLYKLIELENFFQ